MSFTSINDVQVAYWNVRTGRSYKDRGAMLRSKHSAPPGWYISAHSARDCYEVCLHRCTLRSDVPLWPVLTVSSWDLARRYARELVELARGTDPSDDAAIAFRMPDDTGYDSRLLVHVSENGFTRINRVCWSAP